MSMRDTRRKKKLRALLAEHPARDDPHFVELLGTIAQSRPDAGAEDIFQTVCYLHEFVAVAREMRDQRDKEIIAAERARILRIIVAAFGGMDNVPDIIRVALNLAFETALCTDEAIRALDAHQASHPQGGVLWS